MGLYDLDIEGLGFAQHYASLEAEFAAYAQEGGQWTLLYRFYELLARVLKNKAELGLGLYRAYQKQDRARLAALAGQARQAAEDCGALRTCWRQLWMAECRPQGFEVLELRLAGVLGAVVHKNRGGGEELAQGHRVLVEHSLHILLNQSHENPP